MRKCISKKDNSPKKIHQLPKIKFTIKHPTTETTNILSTLKTTTQNKNEFTKKHFQTTSTNTQPTNRIFLQKPPKPNQTKIIHKKMLSNHLNPPTTKPNHPSTTHPSPNPTRLRIYQEE